MYKIFNYSFFKLLLNYCVLLAFSNALNIDEFGAISNDSSYNASINNGIAFNNAIYAANSGFDRVVSIDAGKIYYMLPSDTIYNITNVTIQLDGRLNAWDDDHSKWPVGKTGGVLSFISFINNTGLILKGNGIVNGNGYKWWWEVILSGKDNRPNLIDIFIAKDLLIDGITVLNSPQYHFAIKDSLNVTMKNVVINVDLNYNETIFNLIPTFPLNTDGIDIAGRDIYFKNLTIQNFDDAVAVKPTRGFDSFNTNCTENLLIEDSYVKYGVGMSIGSVPPNENTACIRNVTFRNIYFKDPLKAIYIKPNPGDNGHGLISDITYENIEIHDAIWWAIYIGTQQQHQPHRGGTPCSFFFPLPGTECITNPLVTVQNIVLRNVNIYGGVLSPGILICNSTNPCNGFLFDNVNVYNRSLYPVGEGYYCENINGIAKNSNLIPSCFKDITFKN
jgi:polygalacturonase